MTPQPLATAPSDGSWILAYVGDDPRPAARTQPWVIVTRCDGGWADDDGYIWQPSRWISIPDPQPANSGYTPPEGTIRITFQGGFFNVWVELPSGDYDQWRDHYPCGSLARARERARDWSTQTGLPIKEDPDMPVNFDGGGAALRFLTGSSEPLS